MPFGTLDKLRDTMRGYVPNGQKSKELAPERLITPEPVLRSLSRSRTGEPRSGHSDATTPAKELFDCYEKAQSENVKVCLRSHFALYVDSLLTLY